MVYLNLKKEEFTPEKIKEAEKQSMDELGDEEGKGYLRFDDDEAIPTIEEITDEEINVIVDGKFGYISLDLKLTADDLIALVELAVKKLNKYKTIIEGLK